MPAPLDVENVIRELTLGEKIRLLAGKDTWATHDIPRLNIPSITTSDGPHGVRGTSFFNGPKGCLLPSATAMGATFDTKLMKRVGELLASEALEKGCQVILAPTVCLQRSPLIGRGFEAFGEDPVLSGLMASEYINGVQKHNVAVSIKHYAAHDQSAMSMEDSVIASERTLRETSLLPFQLAVKHSNPWSVMTSYHKINGVLTSESEWLLKKVLREEWGWDGLVMSDWFGVYSTSEAVNAGLDLEMPGPVRWRGDNLTLAMMARKVKKSAIEECVRNVLNLANKVSPALDKTEGPMPEGDSQEKRNICREVANSSIVLLKNDRKMLPLKPEVKRTYGLIGPNALYPAAGGGGSADLRPHYVSKPIQAFQDAVGENEVRAAAGCEGHLFSPLLEEGNSVPGTHEPGYFLEWFGEDPEVNSEVKPLATTTATQAQMYFADNLPSSVPQAYWLRVKTTYSAYKTGTMQFGLCVLGKGKMLIDGKEVIDLWTSQPPKTLQTPMFNQASMEVTATVDVEKDQKLDIEVVLKNERAVAGLGALNIGGLRIGCCEKVDPEAALAEAVQLAKDVDVPVVIAGLNADYESEATDRADLKLPTSVDKLISSVLEVRPDAIIVIQAGCPVEMPWVKQADTLVHAWFGGQETGNAIADVLFGKVNASGRLSVTFPERLEDTPAFLSFGKGTKDMLYSEGVFIGYRYYEKLRRPPMFHFGYGLSYTSFEYSDLVAPETFKLNNDIITGVEVSVEVSVAVQNTGEYDGHEIVQVYVQDVECAAARPMKELKGFVKVWVPKGQTVQAKVVLDKYAFSFWDEEEESWLAEKGDFKIIISRSADPQDHVIEKTMQLEENYTWSGV